MLVFLLINFINYFVIIFAVFFIINYIIFNIKFLLRWAGIGTSLQNKKHEKKTKNLINKFLLLSNR